MTLATNSKSNMYEGVYFRLENDLNMNGVEIGTIGVNGNPFNGTFDGNGHAIRNITISLPEAVNSGLFGFISTNSTVKNIILDRASISGKYSVGALVGYANSGATIKNCLIVNASVTGSSYAEAGIIVGHPNSGSTISGNYYYGCSVTIDNTNNTSNIGTGNGDITGTILSTVRLPFTMPIGYRISSGDGIYYDGHIYTTVGHTASDFTVGPTTWTALQTALDNASTDANNPTVLTLADDITASSSDTYLTLSGGRHVILDLNGHTIDRHMAAAQEGNGHVIQVSGSTTSLTIRDSSPGQTGTITGGWNRYGAGCINATNGATLRLESGTISGNRVAQNGGAISLSGNFYMTGGTITGNAANLGNMNSIYCAGALYFSNSSHFYMSGGSITGNYCGTTDSGAAGIGCYTGMGSSHVHLSGTYDISGNQQGTYDSSSGTWSNLSPSDILNHERITYDIDAAISPSQPARMIIAARDSKATFTSGWATYMSGEDPEDYFALDPASGLGIGFNASGEATIGTLHTITLADGLTASATQAAPGIRVALSGAAASTTTGSIAYTTYYMIGYNDGTDDHVDRYAADDQGKATFPMPDADVSISSVTIVSVAYLDENGDLQVAEDVNQLTGTETLLNSGWYVVSTSISYSGTLRFSGDVHLILADGATMNFGTSDSYLGVAGLDGLTTYADLTIYGQNEQTGTLSVYSKGTLSICFKDLTINGGSVVAVNESKYERSYVIHITQNLVINRGTVSVTGGKVAGLSVDRSTSINGGSVNLASNSGNGFSGEFLTINGGSLTVTSQKSHGISLSNDFVFNGGVVTVTDVFNYGINSGCGKIILGATNYTDHITVNRYFANGGISVKSGQILTDGINVYSGTLTREETNAIDRKTLRLAPGAEDTTRDITANQAAFAGQTRYWATFFHSYWNFALPAGAQAFTMGSDHALYRIGDGSIIPARCAVVIMSDSASIEITKTDADAPSVSGNILKGTPVAAEKASLVTDSQKVHVLGQDSGNNVGFYEFTGTTIPANKAYYVE